MGKSEDSPTQEVIKQMLSELNESIHLSPEMILAYARRNLSPVGRSKVALHINNCQECSEVLELTKKFLEAEQEAESRGLESKTNVHLPSELKAKLKLITLLNSKRDVLIEEIAKLLLPEVSWILVKPTIIAAKRPHRSSSLIDQNSTNQLQAAAFSTSVSSAGKPDYDVIIEVMEFVDLLCEQLVEQCNTLADVETFLAKSASDAPATLGGIKISKKLSMKISDLLCEQLSIDESQT